MFRANITEPICELVKYLGKLVDRHNIEAWYGRQVASVKQEILMCPVYEYVEIMP